LLIKAQTDQHNNKR